MEFLLGFVNGQLDPWSPEVQQLNHRVKEPDYQVHLGGTDRMSYKFCSIFDGPAVVLASRGVQTTALVRDFLECVPAHACHRGGGTAPNVAWQSRLPC